MPVGDRGLALQDAAQVDRRRVGFVGVKCPPDMFEMMIHQLRGAGGIPASQRIQDVAVFAFGTGGRKARAEQGDDQRTPRDQFFDNAFATMKCD